MGTAPVQNQKYQHLQLVETIEPNRMIMKCPSTSTLFYRVEHTFPTQEQMKSYSQKLSKKLDISHQYYISPITHFLVTYNNLCSKQFRLVQIFPYESYTLEKQIENRKVQGKPFTDKQIWSILCSCVLVMSHFSRNQIIHYTLNPRDIILSDEGNIKVISSQLSDFQFDHSFKVGSYYSPEVLKSFRQPQTFAPTNKSGVFTLGMTILSITINDNLMSLYDQTFTIDPIKLNDKIMKIQNEDIRQCLKKMLKIAPYERLTFTQIQQMLFSLIEKNPNEEDDPINKLQESILKVKAKVQPQGYNYCLRLHEDTQDSPSNHFFFDEGQGQVLDEEESYKIQQQSFKQFQFQSIVQDNKVLTDKSNVLERETFIVGNKQISSKITQSSKVKTENEGKYYISEKYSRGRYEGYKLNNARQGFGTFYYDEGGRYTGQWNHNKMEGRGALYYTNGDIAYEGEWKGDQLNGSGILYNQHPVYITSSIDGKRLDLLESYWVKYEGNFERDMRSGYGTLFLTNGEYFKGQFKNDIAFGKGTFYGLGNKTLNGIWENGVFIS